MNPDDDLLDFFLPKIEMLPVIDMESFEPNVDPEALLEQYMPQ